MHRLYWILVKWRIRRMQDKAARIRSRIDFARWDAERAHMEHSQ